MSDDLQIRTKHAAALREEWASLPSEFVAVLRPLLEGVVEIARATRSLASASRGLQEQSRTVLPATSAIIAEIAEIMETTCDALEILVPSAPATDPLPEHAQAPTNVVRFPSRREDES